MKAEVVITRIFDAPRGRVWQAWTEPRRAMRWWGPKGFTSPVSKIDLRVGGGYLNDMRSPDGKDYWSTGVYREVVAPERLVMTDSFADEKGNAVPATHYGMSPDWPLEMLITVTFEQSDGKTKLVLVHSGTGAVSDTDRDNMRQGWSESFDKLDEYLAQTKEEGRMLNLNSIMIGSTQPKVLAEFYQKVLGRPADWTDGTWYGWQAGGTHLTVGEHSEVKGKAKEPQRLIFNFATEEVRQEFERIKNLGAKIVKEPYEMEGGWVATFADPDGNYFQLMSPWET